MRPAPMMPARPTISPARTSSEMSSGACQPARRVPWRESLRARGAAPAGRTRRAARIELVERPADEQAHQLRLRRVGRRDAGDLAVAHHRHPVGDARHFLEPVRDIDDADAARGDLAHHREEPLDLRRRQRRRRLVHDQDARGVGQRLGDGDDLPPADRQFADRLVDVDLDADRLEARARLAAHRRPVEHARARQLAAEEEIGGDVEARHEVELLEDRGDAGGLRGARVGEAHRLAVDPHLAGVGRDDAGEDVHQRRLAGAVLAEQRMNLARLAGRSRRRAAPGRRRSA